MAGARVSFTLNTTHDMDIVEWLDGFTVKERGIAIKSALRDYIIDDNEIPQPVNIGNLDALEEQLSKIFAEVVKTRKIYENLAISINNDTMNNDLSNQDRVDGVDPKVDKNIMKLFKD